MKLVIAFVLDLILGDPEHWPHPVRWIGSLIVSTEDFLRRYFPRRERLAGVFLTLIVCAVTYGITFAIVYFSYRIYFWAGFIVESFLIYTALSVKSLSMAALDVFQKLKLGDLESARQAVGKIVGRDTEHMSEREVTRAAVETVAENTVDGILSPLFFAMLGGAPLAMLFKAASTLDSMVGYRNERYKDFGWASARFDDMLNFIPARVCYLLIPGAAWILKLDFKNAFQIVCRDGQKHSSPNSGIAEAAFAGALNVQLGGTNFRSGKAMEYPLLGDGNGPQLDDIPKAVNLSLAVSSIWLLFLMSLLISSREIL